jgi:phospholipase C
VQYGGNRGVDGGNDDAPFVAQRLACAFKAGALPADTFGPSIAMAKIPIDTFVLVVQENRSFDHYLFASGAAPWRAGPPRPGT